MSDKNQLMLADDLAFDIGILRRRTHDSDVDFPFEDCIPDGISVTHHEVQMNSWMLLPGRLLKPLA